MNRICTKKKMKNYKAALSNLALRNRRHHLLAKPNELALKFILLRKLQALSVLKRRAGM